MVDIGIGIISRPRDRIRFDHLRELQANDISAAV